MSGLESKRKSQIFCYLENDHKTGILINSFYCLIKEGKSINKLESDLQRKEIEEHLNRNCCDNRCFASIEWVDYNGDKYRSYLNSTKCLAFFIYSHRTVNNENIDDCICCDYLTKFIKLWNEKKCLILDTVFI